MSQSLSRNVLRVTLLRSVVGTNSASSTVALRTAIRSFSSLAGSNVIHEEATSSSPSRRPNLIVGGSAPGGHNTESKRPKQTLASSFSAASCNNEGCSSSGNSSNRSGRVKSSSSRPNLVGGYNTAKRNVNGYTNGRTNGLNGHNGHNNVNGGSTSNGLTNGFAGFRVNGSSDKGDNKKREYESDLIVVLDMDECLIHSKFLSGASAANKWAYQVARRQQRQKQQQQAHAEEGDDDFISIDSPPVVDSFHITLPDGDLVHVNKRPYLDEFIKEVTSKYETHIFTAAMEIYARPVLDNIDPFNKMFAGRWYRNSCAYHNEVGAYVKDLNIFEDIVSSNQNKENIDINNATINTGGNNDIDPYKRIVLVDNNPLSFIANPENGILVSNFYDDPTDNSLPAVLDLIHELDTKDDVRPTLKDTFNLKSSLSDLLSTKYGNNSNNVTNNRRFKNDMNVA